jgi:hypothetical protein
MTNENNVVELHEEPDLPAAHVEISRLAQLSTLDYEREREVVAKRLSIRLPILDELVERAKQKTAAESLPASLPGVATPPWPDSVNGEQLLDEITAAIRRYVVLKKEPRRRPRYGSCTRIASMRWRSRPGWRLLPRLCGVASRRCWMCCPASCTVRSAPGMRLPHPSTACSISWRPHFL